MVGNLTDRILGIVRLHNDSISGENTPDVCDCSTGTLDLNLAQNKLHLLAGLIVDPVGNSSHIIIPQLLRHQAKILGVGAGFQPQFQAAYFL